jgi:Calcineurin-like phosphoesterase
MENQGAIDTEEFVKLYETKGPEYIQRQTGQNIRTVHARRKKIELRLNRTIVSPNLRNHQRRAAVYIGDKHPQRHKLEIKNGVGIVASDFHFWPDIITCGHRALKKLLKDLEPRFFIANGDVLDFPGISRWDASSWADWERRPKVIDEIEFAQEMMFEYEQATPRNCQMVWTIGNHDQRLEHTIANRAPELAKLNGVHLKDHFSPCWKPAWSAWVNDDVVIKHDEKGGKHAVYNNTVFGGKNEITGHLHALNVRRFDDYNGTRFGADSGMIADVHGPQFVNYTRDNTKDWASGFLVLTFKDGKLLWPEVVHVVGDNTVSFRGQLIKV